MGQETHALYLKEPLANARGVFDIAMRNLIGHANEFEGIVCTGVSGLLLAPMLAMELDKSLVVVRKPDDKDNHSGHRVESTLPFGDRWIFVDDIICHGHTLTRVREEMQDKGYGVEVATYLYVTKQWHAGTYNLPYGDMG